MPIRTQITILVFLTGIVSSALVALLLVRLQPELGGDPATQEIIGHLVPALRTLDALPPAARIVFVDTYRSDTMQIGLVNASSASAVPLDHASNRLKAALSEALGERPTVIAAVESRPDQLLVEARLADGQKVVLLAKKRPAPPPLIPLLPPLVVLVSLSTALSLWAGLRIVAPLTRFAAAVEKFDLDGRDGQLPEEGPTEVRKATAAFNRMRERIFRLVDDRTRMMMAISHDLRTPLTRLRLRMEEVEDADIRLRVRRDMDSMEGAIADAVASLRHSTVAERFERTDLTSVVGTICDEFCDAGDSVEFEAAQRVTGWVRPQAVTRAVSNLVQNATRYGSTVVVRVRRSGDHSAIIEVQDDGPGIPDQEKEAVLKPFYRLDASRGSAGGFGLGLAIAEEVAKNHGGRLTLADASPHGLCACLELEISERS